MTEDANPLGDFLRARRELVDPADHGIRDAGRRRVQGLRREEVAFLAGVSAPYYARLEQGTDRAPSAAVIEAIATVLRLDDGATEHLRALARPVSRLGRRRPRRLDRVSPVVQRMIDAWTDQAAVVVGPYRDVLAANRLAVALSPGFTPGRNLVRDAFLDPATRELHADWREVALGSVAALREAIGPDPDPDPARLVGELSVRSEEFRTMWARHDVHAKTSGTKRYRHPAVGAFELDYQAFAVSGAPGQTMQVFSAAPGTPARDALQLLSSPGREVELTA